MAVSDENTRIMVTIKKSEKEQLKEIAARWSSQSQPGRPPKEYSMSEVASHFIANGIREETGKL